MKNLSTLDYEFAGEIWHMFLLASHVHVIHCKSELPGMRITYEKTQNSLKQNFLRTLFGVNREKKELDVSLEYLGPLAPKGVA